VLDEQDPETADGDHVAENAMTDRSGDGLT
jgi:hypothetical protein